MGKHFSLTPEQRNKIRLARLGAYATPGTKEKMRQSHLGKHPCLGYKHTEGAKRNMSLARLGNTNNQGNKASAETRAKMSAAHSGSMNAFYGKKHTPEARQAMRLYRMGKPTTLGRIASTETRLRIRQACCGVSRKSATRSQTYKFLWQDPEWAARRVRQIVRAHHIRPTKPEVILLNLLETHFPDEWKYVGDGAFIIGRLNPDFVNVNGQKQVIELFGNYWHKQEEEQERIDIFSGYGFATLIIWENELANIESVVGKLMEFNQLKCGTRQSRASRGGDTPGKCRDFTRSILDGDKEKVQS